MKFLIATEPAKAPITAHTRHSIDPMSAHTRHKFALIRHTSTKWMVVVLIFLGKKRIFA